MPSLREQIQMTKAEIAAYLAGRHTMNIATNGPNGFPHLVSMWYGFIDDTPAIWTYGKSQKAINLRRDNRMTCLIEDGETYHTLRGLMLVGHGVVLEDQESILSVGESLYERYTGPLSDADRVDLVRNAKKRIAIRIDIERIVSWDHHKLGTG